MDATNNLFGDATPPPRNRTRVKIDPTLHMNAIERDRWKREQRKPPREKAQRKEGYAGPTLTPPTRDETVFRHAHWSERRNLVRIHLARCCTNPRQLEAWDACGSAAFVMKHTSQAATFRIAGNYCHNRHCEPCARTRANRMAANLRSRLTDGQSAGKKYRFITLSIAHTERPLAAQIAKLYADFKKLRGTQLWKKSQRGGVVIPEIKWDPDSPDNRRRVHQGLAALWHPHLHIIAEGSWINQEELSRAWLQVTGDSKIVDVQMLDGAQEATHYLTKYVTKSTSVAVWRDADAAQEWITASRGLRIGATFGTWRKWPLLAVAKEPGAWEPYCSLQTLIDKARGGDTHAAGILIILRRPLSTEPPPPPRPSG